MHEILSIKLLKPYLGSSIYVWTSVLSITLTGLAIGYFLGANLSKRNRLNHLTTILMFASVLLILTPFYSSMILPLTIYMELKTGILLAALLIVMPVMIFLGTASPLIIQQLNSLKNNNGNSTGIIYSISTIGGILFTIITVYVTIPFMGVRLSYTLFGSLLLVWNLLVFSFSKKMFNPVSNA